MDYDITKIMRDLYTIDPGFKAYDAELRKLVQDLVVSKPQVDLDASFVRRLRNDLMYIDVVPRHSRSKPKPKPVVSPFAKGWSWVLNNKFNSVLAAIALFLLMPLTYFSTDYLFTSNQVDVKDVSSTLSQRQQINYKPENAFGPLVLVATSSPSTKIALADTSSNLPAEPTIKTVAVVPAAVAASTSTDAAASNVDSSNTDQIVYTGDTLSLADKQGTLLQRTVLNGKDDIEAFFKTLNFDVGDLSSISNLSVKTLELSENKAFGYTVSLNTDYGSIQIDPNMGQWKAALGTEPSAPTITAAETITIATTFLSDHTIDTTNYGLPQIIATPDSSSTDITTVLFPLILNKQKVYNVDGTPYGLMVGVNTHLQKVMTVRNLTSQTYDASQYNLETDSSKILSYLNATTATSTVSTSTVLLNTPTHILVRYNTPASSSPAELFVPALIFPASLDSATTTSVIVPLVKTLPSATSS